MMKHSRNRVSGFTLLETLIAMAIMVVAFASILAVESGSIRASEHAKQLNIVAMLAKNTMVDLEYKFEGKTFDEFKKEDSGTFDAPYENYQWKTEIKEIKFPNLNFGSSGGANKNEENGDTEEMLMKLITNFFNKAMREAVVTISWKRGTGEQSFTLSTYWVNLNNEFQLTE